MSRRRRLTAEVLAGPSVGEVTELLRQTISQKYEVVPPNLNTTMDQTGGAMIITAVSPEIGLNIQIQVSDLNQQQAAPMQGAPPAQGQLTPPPMQGAPPPAGQPVV
jgi:hypothetical protein